jgi:hypothetical protein
MVVSSLIGARERYVKDNLRPGVFLFAAVRRRRSVAGPPYLKAEKIIRRQPAYWTPRPTLPYKPSAG